MTTPSADRPEDRLIKLEELTAYQSETIEDLSEQVARQWALIERLRRQLDDMTERVETFEDTARAQAPTQKPPHW
jgi:SlyX protein